MELKKALNTVGVFSLGAGAMISSGLFILPSFAFAEAGTGAILSYLCAGLCMLPAVFTKLELTSAIPKSGGAFFYLTRIFGAPVGMVAGLADWFSIALKSAFALVGIGVFGILLFPGLGEGEFKLIAVAACLLFTAVNLLSVEGTGKFQVLMVVFLIAILGAYILLGYRRMDFSRFTAAEGFDAQAIIRTTGMVFIAYGGITKITAAVEEVKDPKRMLVPGILSAFLVVQVIYLLVVSVTIGVMDGGILSASMSPLTDASKGFFRSSEANTLALILMAVAGLLSFFTTANAGILSASRVPMAMSRDGLLPPCFGSVSRRGTPALSILATAAFMIIIIVALDIAGLAKVASLFLMLVFFLENLGLIVIRFSKLSNYRPLFRSPLFPLFQVLGLVVYGILMAYQGTVPLLISAGFIILALLVYLFYGRKGYSRTNAFLAMMKRLSEPDYPGRSADLEDELLEILMSRDDIREDRFDRIVKNAIVLDYDRTITRDELFAEVSAHFARRFNLDKDKLLKNFIAREEQTSTLIWPGVAIPHAIPHVVVEGNSVFDVALVRARFGIRWTGGEVVYAAFCLMGSADERNFHLRALMSIAQTLQDPAFMKAWNEARNERELKTAVILTKRKRLHQEEGT